MNTRYLAASVVAAVLLWGCAGPPPLGYVPPPPYRPAGSVAKPAPPPPIPAKVIAPHFYIITFDARGIPHDRSGTVVDRERVRFLVNKGDIDRHTGIRIEVPKGITDREKSIEAFGRAQQVAKIFDVMGFDAVVVVLAESSK